MASRGKTMKLGVREKKKKGIRKNEENYVKKGGKGLKNASFWGYKLKKFNGGASDPPAPPANIFIGGKK